MEGLQQSETPNSLEKKATRKWRKNTEVKILRSVGDGAEGHVDLWRNVIGETPKENKKVATKEKSSQESKRLPATEAHNIHGGLKIERIGQVLLSAAEAQAVKQVETPAERSEPQKVRPETIIQYVATVGREELLNISSRIAVEGTTLRQAYETHLIGENALRRLIVEHIQGGDVRVLLRKEMMEHEIDFERDPHLRDHANQVIEEDKKESSPETVSPELMIPQRPDSTNRVIKAKPPRKESPDKKPIGKKPFNPQVMDIAMISIIIVLLVVVIILLVLRH
jgi:hypothetical protein